MCIRSIKMSNMLKSSGNTSAFKFLDELKVDRFRTYLFICLEEDHQILKLIKPIYPVEQTIVFTRRRTQLKKGTQGPISFSIESSKRSTIG